MRFWMTGIFASAVTGLIWVALWQLVLTMTAILTTGAALPLQLGPAALAGLLTALFAIMHRPAVPAIRRVSGILLLGVLLIGLSMGTPVDPQGVLPAWQRALLLVIFAIAGWMSIEKTLAAAPAGRGSGFQRTWHRSPLGEPSVVTTAAGGPGSAGPTSLERAHACKIAGPGR